MKNGRATSPFRGGMQWHLSTTKQAINRDDVQLESGHDISAVLGKLDSLGTGWPTARRLHKRPHDASQKDQTHSFQT
jgi:hypothetical protein